MEVTNILKRYSDRKTERKTERESNKITRAFISV